MLFRDDTIVENCPVKNYEKIEDDLKTKVIGIQLESETKPIKATQQKRKFGVGTKFDTFINQDKEGQIDLDKY